MLLGNVPENRIATESKWIIVKNLVTWFTALEKEINLYKNTERHIPTARNVY